MAQGWTIDSLANTITFNEAPANGAAIVVQEYPAAAFNATDLWAFSAWNPGYGYPKEVEFFSDRLVWACTMTQPQTLFMSKTSDYTNHGRSVPGEDSDAIVVTINARQVNAIQELIPLDALIVMTTSAEWKLTTGADEIVAPGKVGFVPQSYYGSSDLQAQVIGDTALFVQGRGYILRDLGFQFTRDGYTGNDLTIYSNHLVENRQIVDTAFQQVPYSVVWMVTDDGKLLSVTYMREQEVVGWALHETMGRFVTCCTIPEGDHNALYVGVEREVGGVTRRFVERLDPRVLEDQRDAFFVDSGLTFDGRGMPGTVTLTGGTSWSEDEVLTATFSEPTWVGTSDVGDYVDLFVDGVKFQVAVVGYVSPTVVQVQGVGSVPVAFRGVAIGSWDLLRGTITGLEHLEGVEVSILADASVQNRQVVMGGAVNIDYPSAVVHVGMPYRSLAEALDVNVAGQETVRSRPKLITELGMLVKDTRGMRAGPDEDHLDDVKMPWDESDELIPLYTGLLELPIDQSWNKDARFVVVQDDPLPATLLGVIPKVGAGG